MPYQVQVVEPYSYIVDSNGKHHPVIKEDCGHKHRTLSGVAKCYKNLAKQYSDGMYSALWYKFYIANYDGSKLSEEDADKLYFLSDISFCV